MLTCNPDKARVLLVLDIHNFMLRCYFAKGFASNAKNKQGYKTGHVYLAMQKLRAALKYCGDGPVCLMLSAQENSHVRKKLYPAYKGNRQPREYESYEIKDYEGNIVDKTRDPIEDGMEALMCFPCVNVEIPNGDGETDDAIAAIKRRYSKTHRIVIITEDHDAWALMGKNVEIISKPEEAYTKEHLWNQYGIRNPKLLPLVKALFGDSSDNIENVPGLSADTYSQHVRDGKPGHYLEISNILNTMERNEGEKNYAKAFFRAIAKSTDKRIAKLVEHRKSVISREKIIKLRSKIGINLVQLKGDPKRLGRLLDWYDIRKDAPSMVAIASSSVK